MMGIQRPDGGRVTLLNNDLQIFQSNGDVEEQVLDTPEKSRAALEEHFGITPVTF